MNIALGLLVLLCACALFYEAVKMISSLVMEVVASQMVHRRVKMSKEMSLKLLLILVVMPLVVRLLRISVSVIFTGSF
mgnify:CR=1 FL=1|jgi:hypothetical protein